MQHFVNVILPLPIPKVFTYSITPEEYNFIKVGMRIVVPFGKTKKYAALSHQTHTVQPAYEAKPIDYIIDESPVISPVQMELWEWISSYYMSPMGSVLRAALPSILLLESETELHFNQQANSNLQLSPPAAKLLKALQKFGKMALSDVIKLDISKRPYKLAQELMNHELIQLREEVYTRFKPKEETRISLDSSLSDDVTLKQVLQDLDNYPKQKQALLQLVQHKKPITKSQFVALSGVSKSSVDTLLKKGVFAAKSFVVDRLVVKTEPETPLRTLTEPQKQAFQQLQNPLFKENRFLLHGVTSSGKTEVYMHLIQDVLNESKQVLFLVPEIALTTQIIQRLYVHFGTQMAVYHSRYTPNERVEVWNKVLHQKSSARLVVGARSAVLLPFSDLGLIVVDESHEVAYKQFESNPRYHARDVAVVLAKIHDAKIVLGSASPTIESSFNSSIGKYERVVMDQRFRGFSMPKIELIDLQVAQKKKQMKGHFSDTLLHSISSALDANEQIILFQNRRGFSPFVNCTACAHVPQCPNCDVSLTFHKHNQKLKCHYCGYHILSHSHCVACGTAHPRTMGLGTQQVEDEIQKLFPDARVGRMDSDTTRGKYGHRKLIDRFQQHELDILVGTQMLTKGLDFGGVTLVGVVLADGLLNFPDFRAHERAFQMLLQVAGRAGRTDNHGKVLVQTYDSSHRVLKQLQSYDYNGMMNVQLQQRKQFEYPPFVRLIRCELKHRNFSVVQEAANWIGQALSNHFPNVLGPQSPAVGRVRNHFLMHLMIKLPADKSSSLAKEQLARIVKRFEQIPSYRSVKLGIDVDPT